MKITGRLYTITNEEINRVEIFNQYEDGSIESFRKLETGGKGTVDYSNFRKIRAPQLSANACVKSRDNKYLVICNAGDNSVSIFEIQSDGDLKLLDNQKTNATVEQSLISVQINVTNNKVYACHFTGEHIVTFDFKDNKLQLLDTTNLNTETLTSRYTPSITLSPDDKYLLAHMLIEGSLEGGRQSSSTDNVVTIKVDENGMLTTKKFFSIEKQNYASTFITENKALMTSEVDVHATLLRIDPEGNVKELSHVSVDSQYGTHDSQACWQAYDEVTKTAYISNFAYGTITSLKIEGDKITKLNDVEVLVPGNGTFEAIGGINSSAPTDILNLNRRIYQIFAGVGLLIGYSINDDGTLTEINRVDVIEVGQFGLDGISLI